MTCTKTKDMTSQPKTFTGSTSKRAQPGRSFVFSSFLRPDLSEDSSTYIYTTPMQRCYQRTLTERSVRVGFGGSSVLYKYTTALMTAPRLHLSTNMMYKNQYKTNQLSSTGGGFVPSLKATSFIAIHQHPSLMNLQNQPIRLLKHINLLPYQPVWSSESSYEFFGKKSPLNPRICRFIRKAPEYALRALFFWVLATLAVSSRPSWSMACAMDSWTDIQASHWIRQCYLFWKRQQLGRCHSSFFPCKSMDQWIYALGLRGSFFQGLCLWT